MERPISGISTALITGKSTLRQNVSSLTQRSSRWFQVCLCTRPAKTYSGSISEDELAYQRYLWRTFHAACDGFLRRNVAFPRYFTRAGLDMSPQEASPASYTLHALDVRDTGAFKFWTGGQGLNPTAVNYSKEASSSLRMTAKIYDSDTDARLRAQSATLDLPTLNYNDRWAIVFYRIVIPSTTIDFNRQFDPLKWKRLGFF